MFQKINLVVFFLTMAFLLVISTLCSLGLYEYGFSDYFLCVSSSFMVICGGRCRSSLDELFSSYDYYDLFFKTRVSFFSILSVFVLILIMGFDFWLSLVLFLSVCIQVRVILFAVIAINNK